MGRVIYLHGFRSSPQSFKAQMLARRIANLQRFVCPQLPASPRAAMHYVESVIKPLPSDSLIGSSLGGFYSTYLGEKYGCKVVLLNPGIFPARDLAHFVGEHKAFHSDQAFIFNADYLQELRNLEVGSLRHPERYFLIAAKGDELLDWREMIARYPAVKTKLLEGSDHGLSDFEQHIEEVLAFCD